MFRATIHDSIGVPWTEMEPIRIGVVPSGLGTPQKYLTVEDDGQPFARIDAYMEWEGPFQDAQVWQPFIVVAWGDVAHLVDPISMRTISIACDGYFGHLYPIDERLLVASASELISVNRRGEEAWRRSGLGVDGVIIDHVVDGLIHGQGDWDPPDGWLPFSLDLETGKSVPK